MCTSTKHAAAIAKIRPGKDDDRETCLKCFSDMEEYLANNAHSIYDDRAVSYNCMTHPGQPCQVRWSDERSDMDKTRPATISIGSPLCRPFCPDGGKLGKAHPAEEARLAYVGEFKYAESLDLNITEESHLYPAAEHCESAKSVSRVPKYVIAAPFDIGWPLGGERFFGLVVNPERFIWIGPSEDNVTMEFLSYFQASVEVDGSIYAHTDSEGGIMATRKAFGQRKSPPLEVTADTKTRDLLPPSGQKYLDRYYVKQAEGKKNSKSGSLNVDISQNPDDRHRAGGWLPRLSRSSVLVHLDSLREDKEHIYSERELSGAHGWPTLDAFPADLKKLLNFDLSGFDLHKQSETLGEGIHLPLMLAIHWYFLANLLRRCDLEGMCPELSPHIDVRPWAPKAFTDCPIVVDDENGAPSENSGEGLEAVDASSKESEDAPSFDFASWESPKRRRGDSDDLFSQEPGPRSVNRRSVGNSPHAGDAVTVGDDSDE